MRNQDKLSRLQIVSQFGTLTAAALTLLALVDMEAQAQSVLPVEGVTVRTDRANDAVAQAPTLAPLDATQPTSVVSGQFIQNNLPPQSDYGQVVGLTPSGVGIEQNGPGGAFAGQVTIRGFQDGQYNVTLDGIPFGDSNNYTHHTSAYFMNRDLGNIIVDRGPGTASTIGNATFGGTVELNTKAPAVRTTLTPYAAYGSFNTALYGGQVDSGVLPGGGSFVFDAERTTTDGAISLAAARRDNFFFKAVQPIGDRTTLTLVGLYNTTDQYFNRGASRAQIAQFGPGYGFSDDPRLQNYYKYNRNKSQSDLSYLGINSQLDENWSVDNKIYTYGYFLTGVRGLDVSNVTNPSTVYSPNDVAGTKQANLYRAFGDTVQVKRLLSFGDIKVGAWIENQSNGYTQQNVDLTRGYLPTPNSLASYSYLDHEDLFTLQPYVELDIKPAFIPGLTVTPGIKYSFFQRSLDATVNVGTGQPLKVVKAYSSPQPAVTARYELNPNLSVYAQYAKGFLAPNLNYIQNADPSKTNVDPQQTNNYQVGTSYQNRAIAISGDVYYIDFSNMVGSRNVGVNTIYFNQGAVDYYGVEGETTVSVGHGVQLYGNGSLNVAKNRATGQPIANAPEATWALGLLYNTGPFGASLINKWVGSRYGDTGLKQGLEPFNQLDAAVHYTVQRPHLPPINLKLQVNNIIDSRKIIEFDLYAGSKSTPIYFTQPGRSAFFSIEVPI